MIVTEAPLGSVWVSVPVPLSATTVFVSPGSTSVSLASTPGAATLSGVSSSVVPVSSTAFGGSLTRGDRDAARRGVGQRRVVGDGERHGARERRRALGGVDVRHVAQRGLVGGRRRGAGQRQRVADLRPGRDAGVHAGEREHVLGAGEVRGDRDRRAGDHRARVGVGDRQAGVDRRRRVVLGVGERAAGGRDVRRVGGAGHRHRDRRRRAARRERVRERVRRGPRRVVAVVRVRRVADVGAVVRDRAVRRLGDRGDGDRPAVDVGVVGEHEDQRHARVLADRRRVVHRDRGVVDGGHRALDDRRASEPPVTVNVNVSAAA